MTKVDAHPAGARHAAEGRGPWHVAALRFGQRVPADAKEPRERGLRQPKLAADPGDSLADTWSGFERHGVFDLWRSGRRGQDGSPGSVPHAQHRLRTGQSWQCHPTRGGKTPASTAVRISAASR
jgi:hypothetical protein